jgi:hypothetical protein
MLERINGDNAGVNPVGVAAGVKVVANTLGQPGTPRSERVLFLPDD